MIKHGESFTIICNPPFLLDTIHQKSIALIEVHRLWAWALCRLPVISIISLSPLIPVRLRTSSAITNSTNSNYCFSELRCRWWWINDCTSWSHFTHEPEMNYSNEDPTTSDHLQTRMFISFLQIRMLWREKYRSRTCSVIECLASKVSRN
jgi:hypothetical protein